MRRDFGIDVESLHPEVARAYGLSTSDQTAPSLLFVFARFIGWLGIALWLGGLVVVQKIVLPQLTTTMSYMAPLVRHVDWQARAVYYTVSGSLGTVSEIALGVLVFLILLSIMELRADPRGRLVSRMPLVVTVLLGAVLIYSLDVRFDIVASTTDRFISLSDTYNELINIQIALLMILALAFVWAQTASTSSSID